MRRNRLGPRIRRFRREQSSALAALVLAAACALGAGLSASAATQPAVTARAGGRTHDGAWSFASDPSLHPPSVTVAVNRLGGEGGYLFTAPIRDTDRGVFKGRRGPLLVDNQGNPVWVHPLPGKEAAMDFRRQSYHGQPVLTWWQGHLNSSGIGSGEDLIANDRYQTIAVVHASKGLGTDHHEFLITQHGTAFLTAYRTVTMDLTGYGGSSRGKVLDNIIQEVDIKSGKVVWRWDALKHIGLGESYAAPGPPAWDAFHFNAVSTNRYGDVLITARNTWAIYAVKKRTGAIEWRLGGKRTSFKGPGARFAWEHDGAFAPHGTISLFDDEASPAESTQSRAMVVRLHGGGAVVKHQYTHPDPPLLVGSQGNLQVLGDHDVVGWGQQGYFSEFTRAGALAFDAHFHAPDQSYRVLRSAWVGWPTTPPNIAASRVPHGPTTVDASWNGATQVAGWRLLGRPIGSRGAPILGFVGPPPGPTGLVPIGAPVPRYGFETAITTSVPAQSFAVEALDASGRVLGVSREVAP